MSLGPSTEAADDGQKAGPPVPSFPGTDRAGTVQSPLKCAAALALSAAVSLGLARFSYALLLPPMRADLGWTYFTAGAMNTVNAAGYLAGALLMPRWMTRVDARRLMLAGSVGAALLLALHGMVRSEVALFVLRFATGAASALSFVGGGLLAARVATSPDGAGRSGLLLGIYYGGTGVGILLAGLLVPPLVAESRAGWAWAWMALGAAALAASLIAWRGTRTLNAAPAAAVRRGRAPTRRLTWGLLSYLMFGFGYIGYMTFIVTLLREQGLSAHRITAFYLLLGLGVLASSWLWAGLLQRQRGGVPLTVLNGLLAVATILPVLTAHPAAVWISGLLFGSVFLSVVASTTALVRHNLPPDEWPAGIAAFTIVFAAGQIAGPSLVGLVADGAGGLARGLAYSAGALALGATLAVMQKPLANGSGGSRRFRG